MPARGARAAAGQAADHRGAVSSWSAWTAAFERRLGELGWTQGRTVAIEYRWGEGRTERFAEIAAEFVKARVDVIVTAGSAVPAVKQVTSVIPIVFALAIDPVGGGLVESLARPGGNVTGMSDQQADLASKRVEILREAVPALRRLAILANAGYHDSGVELADVEAAARRLGLEAIRLEIRRAEDVAPAFQALKGQADALYVVQDGLVGANRARIVTFVLTARLPTMWPAREYIQPGGLLSYGPSFPDLFRRAAEITDKILHGAKPADIPVEQPTKFDFVVNLTTAKALGLNVPQSLLARADEVIE
jgi:putative tryptophan/tyrosine transport system substrate-binding protein